MGLPNKYFLLAAMGTCAVLFFSSSPEASAQDDCKPGYIWKPNSGVGCVQENCNDIPDAHWGYVQDCVCGSSGSIHEKDTDPNKECIYSADHESCPSCVYACVHNDEECPETKTSKNTKKSDDKNLTKDDKSSTSGQPAKGTKTQTAATSTIRPALSTQLSIKKTCQQYCETLKMGGRYDEVLEASGKYPDCKCVVDIRGNDNMLIKTISQNGDKMTTHEFDPKSGALIKKTTISRQAERERIRQQLGYKYSEQQIDALLDDEKINKWFQFMMKDIDTRTSLLDPQYWWQHMVAIWDHGYGNSADFVDTYNFGRCGDSMQWLEQNLSKDVELTGKKDKRSEAMLSITGEKYGNVLNHVGLMIRPKEISNIAWADIVSELIAKTQKGGMTKNDLKNVDPRLLNAKILDPYFKKTTTVKEFIKGWSTIKIS